MKRDRLKLEFHYGLDRLLGDKINKHLDKVEAEDTKNPIEADNLGRVEEKWI